MARDSKARSKRPEGFQAGWGVLCGLLGLLGLRFAGMSSQRPHSDSPTVQSAKDGKRKSHGGFVSSAERKFPARSGGFGRARRTASKPPIFTECCHVRGGGAEERDQKDKDREPGFRGVPGKTRRGHIRATGGLVPTNFADAVRVRAQTSPCQRRGSKVAESIVDNDTWHRLRIGPQSQVDELNRLAPSCARPMWMFW